jgi:excinuclease UvrABC ATPase subunit
MSGMNSPIRIVGAREHNLKNVTVDIPRDRIVVITGVSGSGKSSLVFDTLYAEAQRQLLETFSAYARGRLPKMSRPNVEEIRNLSPVIVIDQKRLGKNPRSTVGTATEIFTYLRLLYARCGTPRIGESNFFSFNEPAGMCPKCRGLGRELVFDLEALIDDDRSLNEGAIKHRHFAEGRWMWKRVMSCGLFDLDKPLRAFRPEERNLLLFAEKAPLRGHEGNKYYNLTWEGIVTGIKRRSSGREGEDQGSPAVEGRYFRFAPCALCDGSRLNERARSVKVDGRGLDELAALELTDLRAFLRMIKGPVAAPVVKRAEELVRHLVDIGIGYVSLNQSVTTLSGGESQRIKMARQLGGDLVGLIYVLDEPSIGLHPRDVAHLLAMIEKLRDKGNSVIVVEHDPAVIRAADHIIDIGPGAGRTGGEVVFTGTVERLIRSGSITGECLRGGARPESVARRTPTGAIRIRNARANNLRNITVDIPTGVFVCVTGVAGSGKSSLIEDVFIREHPEAVVMDQAPVQGSVRSNSATYVEIFGLIRKVFAAATGRSPSLFSFNSAGACPNCKGNGFLRIEMHFLDAVTIPCEVCRGRRYLPEVLGWTYKDRTIADVLAMTVTEAGTFFDQPEIRRRLGTLEDVGLEYLELGQRLDSLSGGEAQRIKLAAELWKKGRIYVMDEPTIGLHLADIGKLLKIIDRLVEAGNTVIVIEHNLDVIRRADWVIDLGPEGGKRGGTIVAQGTPEEIAAVKASHTGRYLRATMKA